MDIHADGGVLTSLHAGTCYNLTGIIDMDISILSTCIGNHNVCKVYQVIDDIGVVIAYLHTQHAVGACTDIEDNLTRACRQHERQTGKVLCIIFCTRCVILDDTVHVIFYHRALQYDVVVLRSVITLLKGKEHIIDGGVLQVCSPNIFHLNDILLIVIVDKRINGGADISVSTIDITLHHGQIVLKDRVAKVDYQLTRLIMGILYRQSSWRIAYLIKSQNSIIDQTHDGRTVGIDVVVAFQQDGQLLIGRLDTNRQSGILEKQDGVTVILYRATIAQHVQAVGFSDGHTVYHQAIGMEVGSHLDVVWLTRHGERIGCCFRGVGHVNRCQHKLFSQRRSTAAGLGLTACYELHHLDVVGSNEIARSRLCRQLTDALSHFGCDLSDTCNHHPVNLCDDIHYTIGPCSRVCQEQGRQDAEISD